MSLLNPGSNIGAVFNYANVLVGGLTYDSYTGPGAVVATLSMAPAVSPTLLELNGP